MINESNVAGGMILNKNKQTIKKKQMTVTRTFRDDKNVQSGMIIQNVQSEMTKKRKFNIK